MRDEFNLYLFEVNFKSTVNKGVVDRVVILILRRRVLNAVQKKKFIHSLFRTKNN